MRLILALLTLGAGWMLLTRGAPGGQGPILLAGPEEDGEPESWLAAETPASRAQAESGAGL